jgi:hypothetical protein
MAFVLPMFISKSFKLQKRAKQFNSDYSSYGDGAIRTKSSAKASINNCSDAIVYSCLLLLSILRLIKYSNKKGYILSKNNKKSSGEAPSPCFTPMFYRNSYNLPVPLSLIMPLDYKYILRIIYMRS